MYTPQPPKLGAPSSSLKALVQCRLEITYSATVFTSARCASYGGGDMITYCCTLAIHSCAFAESVVSYGTPAGPKKPPV